MIEYFRRMAHSTGAKIFFALLALCFVFLWGGNDALQMLGRSRDYTVAKVAGHKITTQDVGLELQRELIRIRLQTGQDLSEAQIKEAGLERQTLENLIIKRLIELEANKLGLTVSDAYVASMIKKTPFFQTEGRFTKDRFIEIIQRLGFRSETEYVKYVKDDILRDRLFQAMGGHLTPPRELIDDLYAWNEQIRTIEALVLDPQKLTLKDKPTENDLKDFYEKNQKQFVKPETRSFRVLVLNHDQFTKGVEVKDAEAKELYDLQKDKEYKGVDAAEALKKIKEQLLITKQDEKMAEVSKDIEAELDSGKSIEEVSKNTSSKVISLKDKALIDDGNAPEDQVYITLAFDQEEGNLGLRESAKDGKSSYYIYVDSISPAKSLPFKEATAKVEEAFAESKKFEAAQKLGGELAKALTQGENINTLASKNGLQNMRTSLNRREVLGKSEYTFLPLTIRGVYSLKRGQALMLPAAKGEKNFIFLIARLNDITNGNVQKITPEERKKFEENIAFQERGDLAEQYINALRKKYTVDINQKFFK